MASNKNETQKAIFNDLFSTTSKESFKEISPMVKEDKATEEKKPKVEVVKSNDWKVKDSRESVETKKKTYNIPVGILEDMEKIVYMDRDIKDNTDLIVKALKKYLSSKESKALLEEFESLKGRN